MTNPFDFGYFTEVDLRDAGFKRLGQNVRIAKNCNIAGAQNIELGDNVRIDSFCSIFAAGNGYLRVGSFVHIAGYCLLSAGAGIVMEDFTGISHGVRIYSRNDDYGGDYLVGPTVPAEFTRMKSAEVVLRKHVIIGAGTVILPGVVVGEGSAVGALSLVGSTLGEWGVYFGAPAKRLKNRSRNMLKLEAKLKRERGGQPHQ